MRKRDLMRICEAHPDCAFLSFTNATLIDDEFCQDLVRVKNFVPAISVEGIGEATDVRRGAGTFAKIDRAMELLRPCPIYENTGKLAEMVEASGAKSTDLEHTEDARDLGEKFRERAEQWAPVAERLWYDGGDPRAKWRARRYVAQSDADIAKYERAGRVGNVPLEERDREAERLKAAMSV